MRTQFQRISDVRSPSTRAGLRLNLPPSYLLIHRVWSSGIGVLAQLGAEAPFRAELERWLPGFTAETATLHHVDHHDRPVVAHRLDGAVGRTRRTDGAGRADDGPANDGRGNEAGANDAQDDELDLDQIGGAAGA
jgi:hypothetical protein